MKTLYLECKMGAAGDMLSAALLELTPSPEDALKRLNALGIPGVTYTAEPSEKCGICGTHMRVTVHGEEEGAHHHDHDHAHTHARSHHHTSLAEIEKIVDGFAVDEEIKKEIFEIYRLIGEAESAVHGVPVEEIHFHEVGSLDAIADVTAVCLLMQALSPDEVVVSPINTGSGTVKCAHGILPVPAPAAALLLKGIPVYSDGTQGELITPTGAALLKHFATRFGAMPVMTLSKVGYGMGKKDFSAANCVRALLGTAESGTDRVTELSCNIDDMTPEALAFASEVLLEAGAREVYTVPVGMKKSRSGILLNVLCTPDDREKMLSLIFRHTSTIGVRETLLQRYVLQREIKTYATSCGEVRVKVSEGYGTKKSKIEYEDIARIAREKSLSFSEAERLLGKEIYGADE